MRFTTAPFFLTDFLTLLIISNERIRALTNLGWSEGERDGDHKSGVDCLCDHELFQYIVPQMKRLVLRAPVNWDKRFTLSVHSYRSAHLQVISNRSNNVIPELEEYMKLRRDMCGINMVFDLVELTEIAAFTVPDEDLSEKVQTLKRLAIDIIACSLDIVSFNADQVRDNKYNLITVLVTHKALTIQGAFTFAGALIKDMVDAFSATERSLLNLDLSSQLQSNHSYLATLFSHPWIWTPFSRAPSSPPITEEVNQTTLHGLHSYVQALRNCIAGTINWAYETELYFGKKGDEIRAFGWVFLSPKMGGEDRRGGPT